MKSVVLALILLCLGAYQVAGQDSLIVGTIPAASGTNTLLIPIYLMQNSGCCFAHIRFSWDPPDNTPAEFDGLVGSKTSTWEFGLESVDPEKREISVVGFNANPASGLRELIFYLQFSCKEPSSKGISIRDGRNQRLGSCDGLGGTEPIFVPAVVRLNSPIPGDANSSNSLSGMDVTFLANYLAARGPAPVSAVLADANGDCDLNQLDITYLINYFEGRGPAPFTGECR